MSHSRIPRPLPIRGSNESVEIIETDTEKIGHFHQDSQGIWHRCYHVCKKSLTSWQFWFGSVVSQLVWFPAEHALWEKTWPFNLLTKALGL